MKKINKLFNLLISYIENVYKIMYLIKVNMNLYVIFLLSVWVKQKMKIFYKDEDKRNLNLLVIIS